MNFKTRRGPGLRDPGSHGGGPVGNISNVTAQVGSQVGNVTSQLVKTTEAQGQLASIIWQSPENGSTQCSNFLSVLHATETLLLTLQQVNLELFHSTRIPMLKAGLPLFIMLWIAALALFLLQSSCLVCGQLQDINLQDLEMPDGLGNASIGQAGRFLEAQLFPAPVNATVPTMGALPYRLLTWTSSFFQLRQCARADVSKCLLYGEIIDRPCFFLRSLTLATGRTSS